MAGITAALFDIGTLRRPEGRLKHVFGVYAAAVTGLIVYIHAFAFVQPWTLAALFLSGIYVLIFPLVAATAKSDPARPSWLDWALAALSLAVFVHFAVNASRIVNRVPVVDELTRLDTAMGVAYAALSVEVTRRTTGLGLALIVLLFLAYIVFGHHLGGLLGHGKVTLEAFLDSVVYGLYGLHGEITRVAASYALLFVLFGALLTGSGGGQFFYDLAASLTGRAAGGPAKIAVISSGLYGTVSGNAVSDVVTTGSITIPMMQKVGYPGRYAAGVEATASIGGSLTPPVMGAAAFVMAEYTGIPYADIALAALGPAFLFYIAVFFQVHFRAKREGMGAVAEGSIPRFSAAMREGGIFLIPLTALIAALAMGYTPPFAAIIASAAVVLVAAPRAKTRVGPLRLYEFFGEATFRMVVITGSCAAAGLVIAGLTMTGLAQKLSTIMALVTGRDLFMTLVIAALLTTILGLGLPTVASYVLAAVLIGPLLQELKVPPLSGHMFLLYYAVMSAISPPVAVAAYAAAGIANANPNAVAMTACRLAFVAFIVPFGFVYAPALLLQGPVFGIALALASAAFGVVLLSAAFEGYFVKALPAWARLVAGAAGLVLIAPGGALSTLVEVAVAAAGVAAWWLKVSRERPAA